MQGKIFQLVYGSIPHSSGYSVLAKSSELEDSVCQDLIASCEKQDAQLYSVPFFPYSISIFFSPHFFVFRETFGGFCDQVGRVSRVMRCVVMEKNSWDLLAGNPFLLTWLLPSIHKMLPKKRNEVISIPLFDLAKLEKKDWENLWWKETKHCWKIIKKTPLEELLHFQSMNFPTSLEISTESDKSLFCRALVYALPHEQRMQFQCESFSLNQEKPFGLCFRYFRYVDVKKEQAVAKIPKDLLCWKISTVVHSIPEPYNCEILAKCWKSWFLW